MYYIYCFIISESKYANKFISQTKGEFTMTDAFDFSPLKACSLPEKLAKVILNEAPVDAINSNWSIVSITEI